MRLLYFSDSYGPHDHRFLALAVELGHEVAFLRRRSGADHEARPLPPAVRRLPPLEVAPAVWRRYGTPLADRLRAVTSEHRIDVIHAGPVQSCAWLAAQSRFPALLTMSWGSDLLAAARFGLGRWLAQATFRRTAAFLGDCEPVLEAAAALGMDRSRSFRVPWGVDLESFRPGGGSEARRHLGWERNTVAICVRAWEPIYGIGTILKGFLAAARVAPDLRLILAGDGSLRSRVVSEIEASGMADRIWLPGYVAYKDLPDLYRAADVYLSASSSDGSSVSLLEAMACGLPAFVTDIPGNREWIEPGRSGRLFAVGDSDSLARLLVEAAGGNGRLAPLGIRARQIASERANWEKNAPKVGEAYRLALRRAEATG